MFNKKQKDSLAKLCFDVVKLIVGGMAIAGIMQKEIPADKIRLALVLFTIILGMALVLEEEDYANQKPRKKRRKNGGYAVQVVVILLERTYTFATGGTNGKLSDIHLGICAHNALLGPVRQNLA